MKRFALALTALTLCAPAIRGAGPQPPPVTVDDRPQRAAFYKPVAPPVTVDDRPQKDPAPAKPKPARRSFTAADGTVYELCDDGFYRRAANQPAPQSAPQPVPRPARPAPFFFQPSFQPSFPPGPPPVCLPGGT